MKKKRLTYRILSIVLAVILVVLTFSLLVVDAGTSTTASQLLIGFTFTVLTLSVFGVIVVFCLTGNWKDE